jgi:hypothetical protein
MKKIFHYFKFIILKILKIIIKIMIGLSLSLGNKPIKPERKDSKTIEKNK